MRRARRARLRARVRLEIRPEDFRQGLAVTRHECIEIDDVRDAIGAFVRGAGDHRATV